jgi:hypothetical protein
MTTPTVSAVQIERLVEDCRKAADYYEEAPGHAGPQAIIDLYRTIARLAELLPQPK